ncbi:MAG: RlmE family RNA methyltransferase [Desulfobacterales bacterium]
MKQKKWEDHYSRKAKKEDFPARSVYKLKEIQKKYRIIKRGDLVLDLGCSPGSWLLYASELAGPEGFVVGVDLKPVQIELPANVKVITGNISEQGGGLLKPLEKKYNIILSDMAPATTGRKDLDAYRSFSLCTSALEIARDFLMQGGCFVCKIFQGQDFKMFSDDIKKMFKMQKNFKPQSSRKTSKEIYVIGIGRI